MSQSIDGSSCRPRRGLAFASDGEDGLDRLVWISIHSNEGLYEWTKHVRTLFSIMILCHSMSMSSFKGASGSGQSLLLQCHFDSRSIAGCLLSGPKRSSCHSCSSSKSSKATRPDAPVCTALSTFLKTCTVTAGGLNLVHSRSGPDMLTCDSAINSDDRVSGAVNPTAFSSLPMPNIGKQR